MVRRNRRKNGSKTELENKILENLERGRKVEGMRGFVEVQNSSNNYDNETGCFIPVTVIRVEIQNRSVCVFCKPDGGIGEFEASPNDLYTNADEVEKIKDIRIKEEQAHQLYRRITSSSLKTIRITTFSKFLDENPKIKTLIEEEMKAENQVIKKLAQHELEKYVKIATRIFHGLELEPKSADDIEFD